MHLVDLICAKTDEERKAADAALAKHNAAQPSDREVIAAFVRDCTTEDGAPLGLDDKGKIVVLQ